MAAIDDEHTPVLADLNAVDSVELVRPRVIRILRRTTPVLDELAVLVKFRHARAAVTVADEERAVREPVNVGWPIEQSPGIAAALTDGAKRHDQLTVVGEFPDDVLLVVDDPHVLGGVLRIHLALVRSAPARRLREPLLHERPIPHEF